MWRAGRMKAHTMPPGCAFLHLQPDLSGRAGYTSAAIQESAAGTAIRFHAPLVTRSAHRGETGETATTYTGVQRPSVGLVGILHYLWDVSGLNGWPGSTRRPQRSWAAVVAALREHLAVCTINRQPAGDVLYVVPPYSAPTSAQADAFLEPLRNNAPEVRRGLLLAEVKAVNPAPHGVRYQLAQQSRTRGRQHPIHPRRRIRRVSGVADIVFLSRRQ